MKSQKNNQQTINELKLMEAHAKQFAQKCYKARLYLESLHSPAPSGANRSLSSAAVIDITSKRNKNRLRKSK
jgi:hypothetical protein